MMKALLIAAGIVVTAGISSCGGDRSAAAGEKATSETFEQKEARLKLLEDSLQKGLIDQKREPGIDVRYAETCLAVYRADTKHPKAPEYLDKAHVIFTTSGMYSRAVMYADTLIRSYPRYKNRPMVLLSLASAYDMSIIPRRKEEVRKYYELLLKENPDLPKEEADNYRFRLEHIDLTYDELIDLQLQKPVNQ